MKLLTISLKKKQGKHHTNAPMAQWHKWTGLTACLLLMVFCLSGVVLNHRNIVKNITVSRKILPDTYKYKDWNNGLMRGTLAYSPNTMYISGLFVYGNAGIWHCDRGGARFTQFNRGLPKGSGERNVTSMAQTPDGKIFALTTKAVYRYGKHSGWQRLPLEPAKNELMGDMTVCGDSLVVTGQSYIYVSMPPYKDFKRTILKNSGDIENRTSALKLIKAIHNGKAFGKAGTVITDIIIILLMIQAITGCMTFAMQLHGKNEEDPRTKTRLKRLKASLVHRKTGYATAILTLIVCISGLLLCPPLADILATLKLPAPTNHTAYNSNPWHERLRMTRYDHAKNDWIIYTTDGFYSMKELDDVPKKIKNTPPVSFKGLNVWQKNAQGLWLIGSFEGMYVWNRNNDTVTEYFTHRHINGNNTAAYNVHRISGYSQDFNDKAFTVDYHKGTSEISQPQEACNMEISLWEVAKEVHTGRIFISMTSGKNTYVFIAGGMVLAALATGVALAKRRKRKTAANADKKAEMA